MSVVKSHENYSLEGAKKQFMIVDDFLGRLLRDEWAEGGAAGGSVILQDGLDSGVVRLTTGAVSGNNRYINWNNIRSLSISKRVCVEFRVRILQATYLIHQLILQTDWSNLIRFYGAELVGGGGTWGAQCQSAGVTTSVNTGIALDISWHIFRIETSFTSVRFYIDGTLVATINTNIPASYLQLFVILTTQTDAARNLDIDYIVIREDR